ncbi:polyketide cyclase [Mycobacterium sp. ITM-2017-0098]|nr:polyketide cyclase [Mycobacterium sp. ITM-2017-0098]
MSNAQVMARPAGINSHRGIDNQRDAIGRGLYTRWISELWSGRRVAAELVAPDFLGHWPTREIHGPDQLQSMVDQTRGKLRELQFVVEVGPIFGGDIIAARWIATGAGGDGPARFTGNDMLRISDGKIVEYWAGTARS